MITTRRNQTLLQAAGTTVELIYHSTVRHVRKSSGSASLGLLMELAQSLLFVAVFYVIFQFLGLRAFAIRGDLLLFLVTGVFLFLIHNKAISAVMGSGSPTSQIMKHGPMTPFIAILSSALAGLYLQVLAFFVILFFIHVFRGGLEILNPAGLFLPIFLSWASGCAIGLWFLVLKPFAPRLIMMVAMVYRRANMIASGKMTPANMLPAASVAWFDWNPLFHTIDQARGHTFVNYFPHRTDLSYAVWFTVIALVIGLMGERWLTKNMSASWSAR